MRDKVEIAVIGGTGLEGLFNELRTVEIETSYGQHSDLMVGEVNGKNVAFLLRHGRNHSIPPHKVNFRANIDALRRLGVRRIIATNAVGAINLTFKPGDLVVPHNLIDFTKQRPSTFFDEAPVTHVDFTQPYCPEIRSLLVKAAYRLYGAVRERAIYICTEGPRFETAAEISMFRIIGGDVVGMTGFPEAVLAREAEICYASICFVSNMAAGVKERLTAREVKETSEEAMPKIRRIIMETVKDMPRERRCSCGSSLKEARV